MAPDEHAAYILGSGWPAGSRMIGGKWEAGWSAGSGKSDDRRGAGSWMIGGKWEVGSRPLGARKEDRTVNFGAESDRCCHWRYLHCFWQWRCAVIRRAQLTVIHDARAWFFFMPAHREQTPRLFRCIHSACGGRVLTFFFNFWFLDLILSSRQKWKNLMGIP